MNFFIPPEESFKIEKAISYLVESYKKSGKNPKPVIFHSITVGTYLFELGYDTDIIITGILHDLIEDTDTTLKDIEDNFSKKIADYVEAVSFKSEINDPIKQYEDMFNRTFLAGKVPTVVKSIDILLNSFYINLVPDISKQKFLIEKMHYFIENSKQFSSEIALIKLNERYTEEIQRFNNSCK